MKVLCTLAAVFAVYMLVKVIRATVTYHRSFTAARWAMMLCLVGGWLGIVVWSAYLAVHAR